MLRIKLTRTHIGENFMRGVITIDDTNFSCYSFERSDPRGVHPVNPTFFYAIPAGTYPVRLKSYKWFPFVPFFECKPYKGLSFVEQENGSVKAGCIGVGTRFLGSRTLNGFDEIMEAFNILVKHNYSDWHEGQIIIKYKPEVIVLKEQSDINDDENFNFAEL